MPEHHPGTTRDTKATNTLQPDAPAEMTGENNPSDVAREMTLESLVNLTEEMEHLNELVMLHVEKSGGFTCTAAYFTLVTPILDMLEVEIRFRYRDGMTREEMKCIIRNWIDREIVEIQPDRARCGKKGSE